MGDPRLPPGVAPSRNSAKLQGRYSWNFSLTLPSTCTVRVKKGTPKTLRLPPSFSEKGASQFISYEIYVRIRRGPLRIDSRSVAHPSSFFYDDC